MHLTSEAVSEARSAMSIHPIFVDFGKKNENYKIKVLLMVFYTTTTV